MKQPAGQPQQLRLGDVIAVLEAQPQDAILQIGFGYPHSYRGYYEQLAFELVPEVPVSWVLRQAKSAVGKKFCGRKGGEYLMQVDTPCWIAEHWRTGETLGAVLLDFMLSEGNRESHKGYDRQSWSKESRK